VEEIEMQETQPPFENENESEYNKCATALVDYYQPTIQQACEVGAWPDDVTNRNLEVSDADTGDTVASISFGVCSDEQAEIIIPADYTQPKEREPFVSIDAPENLPPAGELIYEMIEHIDWIIVSPYGEVTLLRKVGVLLGRLHQNHGYSLETIKTELVQEAQKRGDLPVITE